MAQYGVNISEEELRLTIAALNSAKNRLEHDATRLWRFERVRAKIALTKIEAALKIFETVIVEGEKNDRAEQERAS